MASGPIIKGLERGLRVLQALQMQPDSSLHELHILTRISKPSLLRILHTLAQSGVITRRLADGRYRSRHHGNHHDHGGARICCRTDGGYLRGRSWRIQRDFQHHQRSDS